LVLNRSHRTICYSYSHAALLYSPQSSFDELLGCNPSALSPSNTTLDSPCLPLMFIYFLPRFFSPGNIALMFKRFKYTLIYSFVFIILSLLPACSLALLILFPHLFTFYFSTTNPFLTLSHAYCMRAYWISKRHCYVLIASRYSTRL